MKRSIPTLTAVLILTLAFLPGAQMQAQAMLAPANTVKSAPQFDRQQDVKFIQTTLESKILQAKLRALGLSDAEVQSRLSRLSDAEVHQLASQIRSVHPAGDGGAFLVGVLIIAVLVLLIIYLAKRV